MRSPDLERFRTIQDPPADQLVNEIFEKHPEKIGVFWHFISNHSVDLEDSTLKEMVGKYLPDFEILPDWVDINLMIRSEKFFSTYAQDIFLLLGIYSLPYCYAAANGAQVLSYSGRMKGDIIKRLTETAQFIFHVLEKDAFTGIGKGFLNCLKIRLMHAAVRYKIKRHVEWPLAYGEPINQEDMAGTNLAFSQIIIDGLKKFGHRISRINEKAYLHRWNVIGYLMGLDEELLAHTRKSQFFLKTNIEKRQVRASDVGQELTHQLIETIETSPEKQFPDGFTPSAMRYMLGEQLAEILAIPESNWTVGLVNINLVLNRFKSNFKVFDYINQVRYPLVKDRLMRAQTELTIS
jgi:hypothetical protein